MAAARQPGSRFAPERLAAHRYRSVISQRQREKMISDILEHEQECAALDKEGLHKLEKALRLFNDLRLVIEYRNYFPAA